MCDDRKTADWLVAIGEPTRLAIIRSLATGKKTVSELAKLLQVEFVNLSHHLGVMRTAGVVNYEKSGRFVIYSLRDAKADSDRVSITFQGMCVNIPLAKQEATNEAA